MITALLTNEADLAAQRYGMLVENWRAGYARALDSAQFGTPRQLTKLTEDAYRAAEAYLETETRRIEEVASRVALDGQNTTLRQLDRDEENELLESIVESAGASIRFIDRELRVQIERDIAFLGHSLRKTILHVNLAARAMRIPQRAALMQYRIGNATELKFFFHDRRGQKWPSRKFVRSVWRMNLLAIYNEAVLSTLADHGIETAFIRHRDEKSDVHGMEISMNSGSALPTYADIRDDLFHPNADAILTRTL